MDKEKLIEKIKTLSKERDIAKENFHKFDGMIMAYEVMLGELSREEATIVHSNGL